MADTTWSYPGDTTYTALIPIYWDKQLAQYEADAAYWDKFTGKEGGGSPIIKKTQLGKEAGDQIKIGMQGFLTNDGIYGDATLEGSEEALLFYDQAVYVNQMRNAIVDVGKMSQQRDNYGLHERAVRALGDWYGRQRSAMIFHTIYYGWPPHISCTTGNGGYAINSAVAKAPRYWYCADEANNVVTYSATDATYNASIIAAEQNLADTETDWMSPDIVDGLVAKAKVQNIKPMTIEGMEAYLMVIHPYQEAQLRTHDNWFNAMMNAAPRDLRTNPIFKGSLGYWNGVVFHVSNQVHSGDPTAIKSAPTIDASAANVRRAIFMGSDAVAYAVAEDAHIEVKKDFDYNNQRGEAVAGIWGAVRAEYTSDDGNSTVVSQGIQVVSTYSPAAVV